MRPMTLEDIDLFNERRSEATLEEESIKGPTSTEEITVHPARALNDQVRLFTLGGGRLTPKGSVYDAQPLRHASLRRGSPHTVELGCPQSKTSFCVVRFQEDPDWHHCCAAPRAVAAQSAQSRHYPRSWGFVDSRATSSRTLSSVYPSPTIG
ncbi:hypothetical protein J6590_051608 [Homalodisca vitripennis]|nr:hypothetical protein J6590_051608 [Homalodisca vitripennis]